MSDPNLDNDQKYRATKRLCALIDFQEAAGMRLELYQETMATFRRAQGLGFEARIKNCKKNLKGLVQRLSAAETEVTHLMWQSGKLHLFAPWSEVGLFERFEKVVVLVMHGLVSPVWRLSLRGTLLSIRFVELTS